MLAGPPCESWSKARSVPVESFDSGTGPTLRRGQRILRDVQRLWGFDSLTIREVQQLCVGNALLGFAILAFMELLITGGYPAEPQG